MFKKPKPLKEPNNYEHGYNYALFVLNISMRTEGEMREKMQRRGYNPQVIDQVVAQLKTDKYLNDQQYAEIFLRNMKDFKTWGRYIMKQKMLLKKLPGELIEQVLADFTIEEETEIAMRYVQKQLKDLNLLQDMPYEDKQKLKQRLVSRGFSFESIKFI